MVFREGKSTALLIIIQVRIQDFKLEGGGHLKKQRRAERGAKIFGVFRVKNQDFTPKNHIFSNCGGRRENFGGISYEKSRFSAKKSYFFQFQEGEGWGRVPGALPGSAPFINILARYITLKYMKSLKIPKGVNRIRKRMTGKKEKGQKDKQKSTKQYKEN